MKVLIATTYIYKEEWPEFTRNRTGFGMMVNEIFESVSTVADTFLVSQVITKGHGNVIRHTWGDVLRNAKLQDWRKGFEYFISYKQNLKNRVRYFYYAINAGSFRGAIKEIRPDLIHIQGIGSQIKPFIDICESERKPYIVTLHGLIGLDDKIQAQPWDKQLEKDFLVESEKKGVPVTVISTGMKRRIETYYLHHEAKNITVINNSTKMPFVEKIIDLCVIDLRKQYGLKDEKVIVSIGSICERNNQLQIVRAFATGKIITPCHIFFCGADKTDGEIERIIEAHGLSDKIHILGYLPYEFVEQVMNQADLIVIPSYYEGLGFSIIDSLNHGLPPIVFSDAVVFPHLYNENVMIGIDARDDYSLALGIEDGLKRKWNKTELREFAKRFSLEKISDYYIEEYRETLKNGTFMPIAKTLEFLQIRKQLGYKVLSYVGNFTDNKNQIELVEVAPKLIDEKVVCVLPGREMDEGRVRKHILDNNLERSVIIAGFCSEMDSIWYETDVNVLLSLNDGFGLSIIEGFSHGLPTIAYGDLDAIPDLYDERAMIIVYERNHAALVQEIKRSIHKQWDRKWILQYSKKFSSSNLGEQYMGVYNHICG